LHRRPTSCCFARSLAVIARAPLSLQRRRSDSDADPTPQTPTTPAPDTQRRRSGRRGRIRLLPAAESPNAGTACERSREAAASPRPDYDAELASGSVVAAAVPVSATVPDGTSQVEFRLDGSVLATVTRRRSAPPGTAFRRTTARTRCGQRHRRERHRDRFRTDRGDGQQPHQSRLHHPDGEPRLSQIKGTRRRRTSTGRCW